MKQKDDRKVYWLAVKALHSGWRFARGMRPPQARQCFWIPVWLIVLRHSESAGTHSSESHLKTRTAITIITAVAITAISVRDFPVLTSQNVFRLIHLTHNEVSYVGSIHGSNARMRTTDIFGDVEFDLIPFSMPCRLILRRPPIGWSGDYVAITRTEPIGAHE